MAVQPISDAALAKRLGLSLLVTFGERDTLAKRNTKLIAALKQIKARADRSPVFLHPTKEFAADIISMVDAAIS